ncbi:hypothetical protein HN51_044277 [Arachis hypogaea]
MEVEPKKREADSEGDDLVDVPSKKPKTEDSSVVEASFEIDADAAEDKDEFIDANIQLALAVVKKLQEKQETRACLVFPDKPEKHRASELFKSALDSIDGITIGSLDMSLLDL